MSRNRANDVPMTAGDAGWRGVNMRLHPTLLPSGFAASAVNMRFRNGVPEPRGGCVKMPWTNKLDGLVNSNIRPYTTVWGRGTFSDPDDITWECIAADGAIYRTRDCNASASIPLPPQTSIFYPVSFVQAFGDLILFRGPRLMPLVMTDVDSGFANITAEMANFRYRDTYADGDEVLFPPQPGFALDVTKTYGAGDLVVFEAQHWLANQNAAAGETPTTDAAKWDLVQWSAAATYTIGKTVVYQATRFTCAVNTIAGQSPLTTPDSWTVVVHGLYAAKAATSAGESPVTTAAKWDYTSGIIPYADSALYLGNRVFIPHGRDLVAASDLLNYALYAATLNEFRINQGSSDALVALAKFNDNTIIAFKQNSVYAIENVYGDLSTIRLTELIRGYGLVGAKAFANVGKDIWFLSQRGVVSLTQTEQNKIQSVELPVSDAIQPLIDRINWRYASAAVAVYHENQFRLAVPLVDVPYLNPAELIPLGSHYQNEQFPMSVVVGRRYQVRMGVNDAGILDDEGEEVVLPLSGNFIAPTATIYFMMGLEAPVTASLREFLTGGPDNNVVLVYDFLNQAWSGHDEGDAINVKDFFVSNYNGKGRLFFIGNDGYINLYEDGSYDQVGAYSYETTSSALAPVQIVTTFVTRAYTRNDLERWKQFQIQLFTWWPKFTVNAIFPGAYESTSVISETERSRSRYIKPFDRAAYDVTNVDADHGEPFREDYSVDFAEDFYMDQGVVLDRFQDYTWRKHLRRCDSSIQFEIINTQGRLKILSVQVEGDPGPRREGAFV